MSCDVEELFDIVRRSFAASGGHLGVEDVRLLDEAKKKLVLCLVGDSVNGITKWLEHVREVLGCVQRMFGVKGFTLPKELASFMASPIDHLKKKLFNYVNDYLSGRLGYEDLLKKSLSALTTSLRTNARSCYQLWGFTAILLHLGDMGYHLVYPEHRFINFDRSGKQRLGVIPPNMVFLNLESGFLSFFYEAPRPLSWEDTSDLQRVWSLYTALRPDLMIYGGKVLDVIDLGLSPPIKRPNVIVEFKELEDWYIRVRDLRGYFRRPLTAEEWRFRWWQRLREELVKIADLQHVVEAVESRVERDRTPSMRLKEYQLLALYRATYRPDKMILISRAKTPDEVKKYLEDNGIEVYDGIGFSIEELKGIAESIGGFASYGDEDSIAVEIPRTLAQLLSRISKELNLGYIDTIHYALKLLLNSINEKKHSTQPQTLKQH